MISSDVILTHPVVLSLMFILWNKNIPIQKGVRVCFHQIQLGALSLQQRPVHPPPQENKNKNTKWPPKIVCFKFTETTYFHLHLIKNMNTSFPGKVSKSGEIFCNYILSAMV